MPKRKANKPNEVFGIGWNWVRSYEITDNPRELKRKVRAFNDAFGEDADHQVYIISGSWGYKLTRDKQEVLESIEHEEKLAKKRFRQASKRRKRAEDFFSDNMRLPV